MRRILINDYHVSSAVPPTSVRVGYKREIDVFPCITIHRVGGNTAGKIGYKTTSGDSRERIETDLIQVDIFHLDSIEDLELLDDKIIIAVMSGATTSEGYRLLSNPSYYDDSYESFRTTQTWQLERVVQD